MTEKHKALLNKLKSTLENDPRYLGLIIIGSLATGKSRPDSDVDICVIATDEEFTKVAAAKDYYFGNTGAFEDDEIEIDGKIINMQFLQDAAEKGNEPTRESFRDAKVLFDHTAKLDGLVTKILEYPEAERITKLKRFYSLFECNHYYAVQALQQENDYLLGRCLSEVIFYASRLVLTYNRIYFPCHKAMFSALEKADNIPENFIELSKVLLHSATEESIYEYFDIIKKYTNDLNIDLQESVGLILEDEWSWFTGVVPAAVL